MANEKLIESLNRALSLELTAVIQYMQHSFLVTGMEREVYRSYFRDQSDESHDHSKMLGDKVVSLGGVPTVEPSMIRQSTDLAEMLRQDLEMEREALQAYMDAWNACGDDELPTRFLLESRITDEQQHVEELEKLTSERRASITKEKITFSQVG